MSFIEVGPFSHAPKTITTQKQVGHKRGLNVLERNLAAGAIVPIRPVLPPLHDLPDMVQTLLNAAAISSYWSRDNRAPASHVYQNCIKTPVC